MSEANDSSSALGLLLRAATSLQQNLDELLIHATGLGYAQYKILDVVSAKGTLSQRAIATFLGQTEASISRQIKLLAKHGYVDVKKNKKDSRQRDIKLNSQGKTALEKISDIFFHFSVDKMSKLDSEQISQLSKAAQGLLINP